MIRRARWRVRDLLPVLALLLLLAAFALFGYMTRRPEDPLFLRLESVPVVGWLVELVRLPYRPPAQPRGPGGVRLERDLVVVLPADRPEFAAAPSVPTEFVGGGAVLRARPDPAAPVVLSTATIRRMEVLEDRDPWVHLRAREGIAGWLDRAAPRELRPVLGNEPLPPQPLVERPTDAERLRLAESHFSGPARSGRLGPYALRTDFDQPLLRFALERALLPLEDFYHARYGLVPVGEPAAVVVMFARRADYDAYTSRFAELRGMASPGHSARGLIVLAREGQGPVDLELTLLHEVVHLLNRRALGPALPPWLDEGLAEELSELGRGAARGAPLDEWLLRFRTPTALGYEQRGGLAGLELLVRAADAAELPALERLLAFDQAEFARGEAAARNYAHAGFFLHFALTGRDGALAPGLRAFFADTARGLPPSPRRLEERLGAALSELEPELVGWLRALAQRVGVGTGGTRLSSSRQLSPPPR